MDISHPLQPQHTNSIDSSMPDRRSDMPEGMKVWSSERGLVDISGHGTLHRKPPAEEHPEWRVAYKAVFGVQPGDMVPDDRLDVERKVRFTYEKRLTTGKELHLACLSPDGADLVSSLLRKGARVDESCSCWGWLHESRMPPLHIAAGAGNTEIVKVLLEAAADINQHNWLDGKPHFTALHESVYFLKDEVVFTLLLAKAMVNAEDSLHATPLHWAAKRGAAKIVEYLVHHKADITSKAESTGLTFLINHSSARRQRRPRCGCLCAPRETNSPQQCHTESPLQWALSKGRLGHRHLHFITRKNMSDLLVVARESSRAASRLLISDNHELLPGWSEALRAECVNTSPDAGAITKDWVKILAKAPEAAEAVLEALTVEPLVANKTDYPLPARAVMGGILNAEYTEDIEWALGGPDDCQPRPWQMELAPEKLPDMEERLWYADKVDWQRVDIKMLCLPNALSREILHGLALTSHLRIFAKLGVQAIIDKIWHPLGFRFYHEDLMFRFLEICVYVLVVLTETSWAKELHKQGDYLYRVSWGYTLLATYREFLYELCEFYGYLSVLNQYGSYVFKARNITDVGVNVLAQVILWKTYDDYKLKSLLEPLSLLVTFRWLQLLYGFRSHPWCGMKVSSMWRSFTAMLSMFFILMVGFFGFFHAWILLELSDHQSVFWKTLIGTFRLLAIGDGDGVDMVLQLPVDGGKEGHGLTRFYLILSVILFVVCMLNLFIAVNGEAYDKAQEEVHVTFLQDRAAICLEAMFRPRFSGKWRLPGNPVLLWGISRIIALGFFFGLLFVEELKPVVPAAICLLFVLLGDAILMQLPWEQPRPGRPLFLWICVRQDFREADYYKEDPIRKSEEERTEAKRDRKVRPKLLSNVGRLATIRLQTSRAHQKLRHRMKQQLHSVGKSTETAGHGQTDVIEPRSDSSSAALRLVEEVQLMSQDKFDHLLSLVNQSQLLRTAGGPSVSSMISRLRDTGSAGSGSADAGAAPLPPVPPEPCRAGGPAALDIRADKDMADSPRLDGAPAAVSSAGFDRPPATTLEPETVTSLKQDVSQLTGRVSTLEVLTMQQAVDANGIKSRLEAVEIETGQAWSETPSNC